MEHGNILSRAQFVGDGACIPQHHIFKSINKRRTFYDPSHDCDYGNGENQDEGELLMAP